MKKSDSTSSQSPQYFDVVRITGYQSRQTELWPRFPYRAFCKVFIVAQFAIFKIKISFSQKTQDKSAPAHTHEPDGDANGQDYRRVGWMSQPFKTVP